MPIQYQSFVLENGLKVIVHEDHSIPKAVVDIIYKVGSKDESPHKTGFAHLFEHLMFGGSKNIPHFDRPLQKVGGNSNAFTSSDVTNYYDSVPSNQLETAFWLESDRMLELDFSQKSLDVQKSVVIEEFKQRYLNQPYGDAHLRLREVHFNTHPYHWSTIGKEIAHIEDATLEDVKNFFYGYYAPNNATLIVAGDVTPEKVLALAKKWFGPIPKRNRITQEIPVEPPQTSARTLTLERKVPFPAIYKMYHIPAYGTRDYCIADLLTDLLANGKSSKLFQHMVINTQVASNINAFTWAMHHPGILSIDGRIAEGKSIEEYEAELQKTIDSIQDLSEAALQRLKNKLEATFVLQQTTLLNKAITMALYDSIGNIELINELPAIYQSITLEEVKEGARKYLSPNNCSTLYYMPESA